MNVSNSGSVPVLVKDLSGDGRWALANRIASSAGFAKAAQLRELLLYLCEKAITSPSVETTEQEIGSRVLGRRPDYDTQADNIVRVQIRHLRQKLDEYFASEGRHETLILCIPKGGRVPHFQVRTIPVPPPVVEPAIDRRARGLSFGMAALVLSLALGAFVLGRYSKSQTVAQTADDNLSGNPLWARLFDKSHETTVVISDSSLAFIQDMLKVNLTMNDLGRGSLTKLIESVPDERMRLSLRELSLRQYTSMADATLASRLAADGVSMGTKVAVRYSRHLSIREFNTGNFIIIGSRRGIPWVELFEPDLNFRLHASEGGHFGFENKAPGTDEAARYTTVASADGRYETYATISFLPNPKHTGDVLLLEGIMMEGTEAAGEFALSADFARLLAQRFGATAPDKLRPFEVLLRIQAVSGAANKVEVVAWRQPTAN